MQIWSHSWKQCDEEDTQCLQKQRLQSIQNIFFSFLLNSLWYPHDSKNLILSKFSIQSTLLITRISPPISFTKNNNNRIIEFENLRSDYSLKSKTITNIIKLKTYKYKNLICILTIFLWFFFLVKWKKKRNLLFWVEVENRVFLFYLFIKSNGKVKEW